MGGRCGVSAWCRWRAEEAHGQCCFRAEHSAAGQWEDTWAHSAIHVARPGRSSGLAQHHMQDIRFLQFAVLPVTVPRIQLNDWLGL